MLLRRCIGQQAVLLVPTTGVRAPGRALSSLAIEIGVVRITQRTFHLRRVAQSLNELQGDDRRSTVFLLGWAAKVKILAPIDKGPPRNVSEQSIRPLVLDVPIEHGSRALQLRAHEFRIVAIHPEIM